MMIAVATIERATRLAIKDQITDSGSMPSNVEAARDFKERLRYNGETNCALQSVLPRMILLTTLPSVGFATRQRL